MASVTELNDAACVDAEKSQDERYTVQQTAEGADFDYSSSSLHDKINLQKYIPHLFTYHMQFCVVVFLFCEAYRVETWTVMEDLLKVKRKWLQMRRL